MADPDRDLAVLADSRLPHKWHPLRVTVSTGHVISRGGSLSYGAYRVANALQSAGCDVTLLCAGASSLARGFSVRTVDTRWLLRAMNYTPLRSHSGYTTAVQMNYFDWRASRMVGRTDVLYCYSDQALLTMRAARQRGASTVLHAANTHIREMYRLVNEECARFHHGQRMITPLMVRKIEREYAEATAIRAQSSLIRDSLISAGIPGEKVFHIPPSVDLGHFRPARREPDQFTVAFVGSFDLRKGLPHLLAAFDALALPDARLILHGGSGSRFMNRMLRPYRERQDIVFRSGDPLPTYQEASVCVVPSVEDGFALVVIEALACGIPVIASERVGAREAIEESENGHVVAPSTAEAIAERLRHLYDHPGLRSHMSERARRVAERYSAEQESTALTTLVMRLRCRSSSARQVDDHE